MTITHAESVAQSQTVLSAARAGRFASEYLHALGADELFSAREFFENNPECTRFKSVVLEVTLEEYVRRISAGKQVSPAEMAGQFPKYETAIAKQIEVYEFLEGSCGLEDSVEWPQPGDEFLGLDLHELLGVGAFSKVFHASERDLGDRQVVVKICRGAGEEADFLGRLEHPHITPIYWHRVCADTGLSAIVMPYLTRSTMADVIDHCFSHNHRPQQAEDVASAVNALHSGTSPATDAAHRGRAFAGSFVDGALRWARQLADALVYAHQHSICHSDIKPSNVLMTPAGDAVLVDFSMANDLEIERKTIGGTFPYMAPEQLEAYLAESDIPVSFRSDIFSLGVTVYEFLTGRSPFGHPPSEQSRHATAEWLLKRQKQGAVPVSSINPQVSESMSAVVMECLAIDPDSRPESAAALCVKLKREASVSQRIRNTSRRHRGKLLALSAAVFIMASLTVVHAMTRPPRFETDLNLGRLAFVDSDFPAAVEFLSESLNGLPLDQYALRPTILFERGRGHIGAGDYDLAWEDFAAAMGLEQENGCYIAALGFCEARIALSQRFHDLKVERDELLLSARRRFNLAIALDWKSPEVLFNLAYLDYRDAPTGRLDLEEVRDPQTRRENRKADLDAIALEIEHLFDELDHSANYHLLRIQVERERAGFDQRTINTSCVDIAVSQFGSDLRILLEAACCYAINAANPDSPSHPQDQIQCIDLWAQAVDNGATDTDRRGLTTFNELISAQLRPAPTADAANLRSAPADLLLNPANSRMAMDGGTTRR